MLRGYHKDHRDWIKKVSNNGHKVYCRVCITEMSIGGLGVSALDIHAKGKKHSLNFFSIWVFFHEHLQFTGQQGEGEAISLTPLYHFHPKVANH